MNCKSLKNHVKIKSKHVLVKLKSVQEEIGSRGKIWLTDEEDALEKGLSNIL